MKRPTILALQFEPVCLFPVSSPAEELKFNTQDFTSFNYEIDGVVSDLPPTLSDGCARRWTSPVRSSCFPGSAPRTRGETARVNNQ